LVSNSPHGHMMLSGAVVLLQVIALSALYGKISLDETVEAVRLEEHFQIGEWGMVEGGHDIDLADVKVRVFAPVVFMQLVRYSGR
jgi:ATP synthase F1 complex assembly factor 2